MFRFILLIFKIILFPFSQVKKEYLLELCTLKKEVEILKRKLDAQNKRIIFSRFDKLFYAIISFFSTQYKHFISLVRPKTVLRWYQNFVKKQWTYPSNKKPGRPETPLDTKQIILTMKNENLTWGNKKIQGELLKLGIKLDKNTIARIIADFRKHGKVKTGLTWKKFIQSHMASLFAMDFFTVDTFAKKRFYIFFIIALETRKIVRFLVTETPNASLVQRQLEDWREDKEGEKVYLIHDNDPMFTSHYYKTLGIENVPTSVGAPNMNVFAERFVRSVRNEALDWFIIFNIGQLEKIIENYIKYYNTLRPHQGIGQKVPAGYIPQEKGRIVSYPVLSGLHHYYKRKAS